MRLPSFLVIGAAKGGTTSLHAYLRQHPDIFVPASKETNYYSSEAAIAGRRIPRTASEYARCFSAATGQRAIGDVSPQYMNSAIAAERIARDLPDVRLIATLRNPIDRAYSDYLGRIRIARESRPVDAAIRPGERIFDDGMYYAKLKRFLDRFRRSHLHIILHDDFKADPQRTMREVFAFLAVDPDAPIDTSIRHNSAAAPRWPAVNRWLWAIVPRAQQLVRPERRGRGRMERWLRRTYQPAPPFPPDLRRRLTAAYREDVIATGRLIERDLSSWINEP